MLQPVPSSKLTHEALVALGSNLVSRHGDPTSTLQNALADMEQPELRIRAVSRFYRTPFYPPGGGADFVNAVVRVETNFGPEILLRHLHRIEAASGRKRDRRWQDRTLDLDILMMDQLVLPDQKTIQKWINLPVSAQKEMVPEELLLPHPRLQDRAFVLVPALDVAPDWRHPVLGKTLCELHDALPDAAFAGIAPI
ncbi:MAG: 2-amino-4-hydroxy-6-hydroxymethyldihydropteridine diphosphokinase [Rhodobacterales bacterium]|nr:MAG: 2-amino-4-hydroxy-6-hydroxymethyldihydropteridine diphosphokinase [Rhodobacterales bacterium]